MGGVSDDDLSARADRAEAAATDRDALFRRLRGWYRVDREASSAWRREAREDFDFAAGHQWSAQDEAVLREQGRPPITFNRVLPIIKAVAGAEVNNRLDIQYLGRQLQDAALNEVLTEASRYLEQEAEAEDEESDAFVDCAISGMGWVEQRLDYETNPDGAYVEDRVDPLEMIWDASAGKRNVVDARRLFRAKSMDRAEAIALFPDADEADLDAAWAEDRDAEEPHRQIGPGEHRADRRDAEDRDADRVTIVECQWWERVRVVRVADPRSGAVSEMPEERFAQLQARVAQVAAAAGMPAPELPAMRAMKRVYKRAFLGATVLEVGASPVGDAFSYVCLTADRDHNRNAWFGLVRPMRDPQRYANKWLAQTLDMLNRQTKGGAFAEKGAAADQRQFEESYAKPGAVTWLNDGALMGGKFKPKDLPQLPAGHYQLMEFALLSIRDTSGVNLEMLGQQHNDQAGVLEYQRKQSALTILATLFDALRRARKRIGRNRLYLIQNYLSDGRLIRVAGEGAGTVLPLLRDATAGEYDVVIDDAPTSPNQKEVVWSTFTQLFPVIKDMVTPQVLGEILPYSPFPASFVAKMQALLSAPPQPSPEQEEQRQVAMRTALAKIGDMTAGANLKQAKADREGALAARDHVHGGLDAAAKVAALLTPPTPPQNDAAPAPAAA